MSVAIMQPYFFPYIGYFQLISAVDTFVIYDNIKYTKKGWINRNRIICNKKETVLTLPLKKASDYLDVCQREIADEFDPICLLAQIARAYQRAPCLESTLPLLEKILSAKTRNLFDFLHASVLLVCEHLDIRTPIVVASTVGIGHELRNQDKVIAICKCLGTDTYVNAIGGMELYSRAAFLEQGIALKFIKSNALDYPQQGGDFIPWLSIIDVMMQNPLEQVRLWAASGYQLL